MEVLNGELHLRIMRMRKRNSESADFHVDTLMERR